MIDYAALYQALIGYWNEFAAEKHLQPIEKINHKTKKVLRRRMIAEPKFLHRMPLYFGLIHKYCSGLDEFGNELNLHGYLRTTALLRALREHERTTGESLLNPPE